MKSTIMYNYRALIKHLKMLKKKVGMSHAISEESILKKFALFFSFELGRPRGHGNSMYLAVSYSNCIKFFFSSVFKRFFRFRTFYFQQVDEDVPNKYIHK